MGLNATVTPGITVSSSTLLNAANLNLLGTPTVSITGAIDASDIGANTVGSSELQDDAVKEQHIGSIGGNNWILKGESATSSVGVDSLARNDSNETQISLLVNDKTTLGARYITGAIEATTSGTNKLNLAIKDDSITSAMIQSNAVDINISNLQPGGGLQADNGLASTTQGDGGGIIFFDPTDDATIGSTSYYGKAKVLPVPKIANQVLKSTSSGALSFGTVGSTPVGFCQAYAVSVDHDANATSGVFSFNNNFKSGIYLVRRSSLTNHNKGVLRVFFSEDLLASGTNLGVFGFAVNNAASQQMLPIVTGTVGIQKINNEGVEDLSNGTNHPYVDIKCILETEGSGNTAPDALSTAFLRNPNIINLTFYQI